VPNPRYLVFTAIKAESRAIARAFGVRPPWGARPAELPGGRVPIDLYTIGVGAVRMPDLSGQAVAGIVMAGLAGALDPRLKVGDVVVDQSSTWRANRPNHPRVWFHGVDEVVATPERKSELFGQTGASVIDMETAAAKQAARSYSIPFLGIRAVSDTAAESIDPAVLQFVDAYGGVRVGALIGGVARRPSLIKELRRLARSSRVALDALGAAVRAILVPPG
jgi:hypothetical protein